MIGDERNLNCRNWPYMNGSRMEDPQKIEMMVIGNINQTSACATILISFTWYWAMNELIPDVIFLDTGRVSPGNTRGKKSDRK